MAVSYKGKCLDLCIVLIFIFPRISSVLACCESYENDDAPPHQPGPIDPSDQHQAQLEKLKKLVDNLGELVSRLESRFPNSHKPGIPESKYGNEGKVDFETRQTEVSEMAVKVDGREMVGAVSVTKHSLLWSERFQFVSAVKLNSNPTCASVLPFRDFEGLSKYIAVGDDLGAVYVFLRFGDVMLRFDSLSGSPITAMVSYFSAFKNESVLVTGHANGAVLVHSVWEIPNGDELSFLRMETVGKLSLPEETGSPILLLEVHHVGRTRYILSSDTSGSIRVFRENGTLYGVAVPSRKPLAFLKQRLLFLTETGAGSLDLRTMKIKESACEGLNNSVARNYAFDSHDRSKAYGFTSDGDLLHVLLLGDVTNFKCRVRSKKKFEMDVPLAFGAIKGYLVISNNEKVFVYNVSSQHYVRAGGPKLLFSAELDEILVSFLNYQVRDLTTKKAGVMTPLIASDHEKLVIIGLGSGYIGMYKSNLPVFRGEFNTILWSTPVLFFILFLFGAWHFFANKKEALISWGPDDPFGSTGGAPLGVSGSVERAFADTSARSGDMLDLRNGSGLRGGPTRRYASPPRYGGSNNTFRTNPSEANARPASVDTNFRAGSELKFRGANMESAGFQKEERVYL